MQQPVAPCPALLIGRARPPHAHAPPRPAALTTPGLIPPPPPLPPTPPRRVQSDWIALVASADFFFNDVQNESIAENMRERVRYLGEKVRAAAPPRRRCRRSPTAGGRRPALCALWQRPRRAPRVRALPPQTSKPPPPPQTPQGEDVEMFFVCEPKWLQEKFPAEAAKCKRPAVALVCPDRTWVT